MNVTVEHTAVRNIALILKDHTFAVAMKVLSLTMIGQHALVGSLSTTTVSIPISYLAWTWMFCVLTFILYYARQIVPQILMSVLEEAISVITYVIMKRVHTTAVAMMDTTLTMMADHVLVKENSYEWLSASHHRYSVTISDINECNGTHSCEYHCTNTYASYVCLCPKGYQLNSDGLTCNGKLLLSTNKS